MEVESLLALLQKFNKKVLMVDASGKLEKLFGDYIKIDAHQNDRQAFQMAIEKYNAEHPILLIFIQMIAWKPYYHLTRRPITVNH